MPGPTRKLGKSDKKMSDVINNDMKAGKPQKQAVAMSLNVASKAAKAAGKPSKAPMKKMK